MASSLPESVKSPSAGPDGSSTRSWSARLASVGKYRSVLVLALMFITAAIISDPFLTPRNLVLVISQNSIIGILAVGMTFVILTGGIDLSVGSMLLCAGVITAGILKAANVGPAMAALACLGIGTLLGTMNGLLITRLRVPPFIATLATMVGAISIGQMYSQGSPIIVGDKMPAAFSMFDEFLWKPPMAQRSDPWVFPGVPVSGLLFIAVAVLAYIILTRTRYGRYVYALGGNREATRLSGINTKNIELSVYAISGLLAGVGALIYTARQQSGQALYGRNMEMDAIAAVVIGGASMFGGSGGIGGTIVGVLFVGILLNVMYLENVNPYMQGGIRALAILLGVLLQIRSSKK